MKPLEIMDEIERGRWFQEATFRPKPLCDAGEWQRLRKAFEQREAEIERLENCLQAMVLPGEYTMIRRDDLEGLQARVARLEQGLCEAGMRYSHYDVAHGIYKGPFAPLREHPRQSVAEIEARVADRIFGTLSDRIDAADTSGISAEGDYSETVAREQRKFVDGIRSARLVAKAEADRIRSEAK